MYQHQSYFKKCSKTLSPPNTYKLPNQAQSVHIPLVCPYVSSPLICQYALIILHSSMSLYTRMPFYMPICPSFTFHPLLHFQLHCIRIDQLFKGIRGLGIRFRHSICKVRFALNPLNFYNFPTFIRLVEAHNIDHKALLLCSAQFD